MEHKRLFIILRSLFVLFLDVKTLANFIDLGSGFIKHCLFRASVYLLSTRKLTYNYLYMSVAMLGIIYKLL